jgi:hypothetical protein
MLSSEELPVPDRRERGGLFIELLNAKDNKASPHCREGRADDYRKIYLPHKKRHVGEEYHFDGKCRSLGIQILPSIVACDDGGDHTERAQHAIVEAPAQDLVRDLNAVKCAEEIRKVAEHADDESRLLVLQ